MASKVKSKGEMMLFLIVEQNHCYLDSSVITEKAISSTSTNMIYLMK